MDNEQFTTKTMKNRIKKKKKSKVVKIILAIIALLFLGVVGYGLNAYIQVHQTANDIYAPLKRTASPLRGDKKVDLTSSEQPEAFTVLLLGVDQRAGDRGRSDSIILMSVNKKKNSVLMMSIPRDTRTEIIGRGTTEKINHSYAYGGVDMAVDTIENFTHIPIDYYIQVNMEGFKDVIDALGGITIENDFEFSFNETKFPIGTLQLNGDEALKYSRMRKLDSETARQKRQRRVINAVIQKGASFSMVTNYNNVLNVLSKDVRTNLTMDDMIAIQKNYMGVQNNITEYVINGGGQMIDSLWYFIPSDGEREKITAMFKEQTELP